MADGTLIFDTKIDTSGFDKGVSGLKKDGQKAAASIGDVTKGILGAGAIKAGAKALVDFGKKSIMLASDIAEVQNVVDVTFGAGAAQINRFAKEASTGFGLTELQAKQFTGTIGAMVKSMGLSESEALDMSIEMTKLTGDMASFYNLDHQTAFEKIRSGLSGETEPLKQLGINMSVANLEAYRLSKGIKTTYDKMSEAERVQLRYSYIMAQTSDAQGDFTRTQDGFANQVRILSNNIDTLAANIGSKLIPIANGAVTAINSLFSASGAETPAVVTEINGIIDSLNGLDSRVTEIHNNFIKKTIKINIDYEEAQGLLDTIDELKKEQDGSGNIDLGTMNLKMGSTGEDVAKLQQALSDLGYTITDKNGIFGASTAAAVKTFQESAGIATDSIVGEQTKAALAAAIVSSSNSQLVETTKQLVALYPELEKYVGPDGVLNAETEQVRELISEYRRLAIEKAVAARIESTTQEYYNAYTDLKLLEKNKEAAEQELENTRERLTQLQKLREEFLAANEKLQTSPTEDSFLGFTVTSSALQDASTLKAVTSALSGYINVIGGLTPELVDTLSAGGIDLSKIFSPAGELLSPEEISQSAEALDALFGVYNNLLGGNLSEKADQNPLGIVGESIESTEKQVGLLSTAVSDAESAIDTFKPKVESLKSDLDTLVSSKEEIVTELTNAGEKAGTGAGKGMADSLGDQKGKVVASVMKIASAAQKAASRYTIKFKTQVSAPDANTKISGYSHATGLFRVPYDNYYARLHAGERVLTAAEAHDYNRSENASRTVVQASTASQAQQTIIVTVDGTELARAQVANNRAALNDYSRKVAQGRGHR